MWMRTEPQVTSSLHKDVKPWSLCNKCNKQHYKYGTVFGTKNGGDFSGKSNYLPANQPLCVFHFRVCFCLITLIKPGQAHVLVGLLISVWFKVCGKKVNLANATSFQTPHQHSPQELYTQWLSYFECVQSSFMAANLAQAKNEKTWWRETQDHCFREASTLSCCPCISSSGSELCPSWKITSVLPLLSPNPPHTALFLCTSLWLPCSLHKN